MRVTPYSRPTLTALRNQAIEDITSSGLPHLDGLLRNAVLRVLAWVMAGFAYSLYGFLDWIAHEAVPYTATDEYLEAWAALIGVYRLDATPASGTVTFAQSTPGTVVPSGTPLARQDGTPYVSTAIAVVAADGTVTLPIIASVPGADTNCPAGTNISLATPIVGMSTVGTTTTDTLGGSDQETQDAMRTRMLRQYAAPAHGGSEADYIEWATTVPGCSRAWVNAQAFGPGSVVIYVMFDVVNAANNGLPIGTDGSATQETRFTTATGDQLLVANQIYPLQPVTALVVVMAPQPLPINVTVIDLDPPDVETQAAIIASLHDMFLQVEVGGTIYPSDLYAAIQATPGINRFVMTQPTMPVTAGVGQLPILGTFTASGP